ncbi:MAG TPA: dihydrolipoyl dehydrogenase [Kiritimatiellia bacterium]|nr:dihydrolipoyl dehydrogenase [Kiritimatiellia bacterium]HMO98340.1 dihydrolipoyl dehydrogenase [Kiritimatiellia bacterium]HMP95464.1 dihydrolipoyl dehydrogenase [Kiritimatiellia bacterium]
MTYDLIIIGAGPGGYIAAERAGHHGLKVLLIEKNQLGGVCLNEGCIPSKTLLNSAKIFHYATHGAAYGVTSQGVTFDFVAAQARKTKVMDTLRNGIAGLMKKYRIEVLNGAAKLDAQRRVVVDGKTYEAKNILIATGSSPARPPIPGIDLSGVVNSTGILNLEHLPKSLVVIGGGVIGCEFACFFGSVGIPVTVIEMLPEICPPIDPAIAKILRAELEKKNITFHIGATVKEITNTQVTFTKDGKVETIDRDVVLVSTGRAPNVGHLGFEEVGLDVDRRGIKIDNRCRTNLPGVWAIGDVTGKSWLAHGASRMGEVVVNNILGHQDIMRFHAIPAVVYTQPEVATVGMTEEQAIKLGIPVKTGKMPMTANGRFLAEHDGERGQVKVVLHAETDVLLGVHMIGASCSEIIYGAAAMIEMEFRAREIKDIIFPHPTVSEVIRDTVFSMD